MSRRPLIVAVTTVLLCTAAHAQIRRPKAVLTPATDAAAVPAGSTARATLNVTLPPGLHVQADHPRDPSLIPTALTLTPPAGVTVAEIVYPQPAEFKLSGSSQPLAVFGENFTIGVRLAVAPTVAPGDITVPARLRYQACDASSCFPPTSEAAQWTLHIVAGTP